MVFQNPRTLKVRDWETWVSPEAGYSSILRTSLNKIREKIELPEKAESVIRRGIADSRIWCLDLGGDADAATRLEQYKILYAVVEVCRRYACNSVCIGAQYIYRKSGAPHPWISEGSYADAIRNADLLIVDGSYPDPDKHPKDNYQWENLIRSRLRGTYKPTVFLTSGFKALPPVKEYFESIEMLASLEEVSE